MVLLQQTSTQTDTGPLILQREEVQDLQGYYYANLILCWLSSAIL